MRLVIYGRFFFCMGLILTIETVTASVVAIVGHHNPMVLSVYAIEFVGGVAILILSVLMMLRVPPDPNGPRKESPLEPSCYKKAADWATSVIRRFFLFIHQFELLPSSGARFNTFSQKHFPAIAREIPENVLVSTVCRYCCLDR